MNESGFLFLRKFGKISIRKIVPESGTQGESGNGGDQKKVVPESGTQGESGNGGDQKKVVPKSGTQRECRNRQRSEESCTGIRYAVQIADRRNFRNRYVRRKNPGKSGSRSEESCTEIRYVRENPGTGGDQKKVVPESGTQRECGNRQRSEESCTGIRYAERMREQAAIRRKLYRNPVRRENPGTGGDQKKVVPESGTQRECRNRQRSEESCTGIRYAERMREQAAIRRKLYRNPVRRENAGTGSDQKKVVPESGTQGESGNRRRSEESCTEIRYAGRIQEQAAIRRKLYRNPVRRKDPEMGSDQKKVVPESGTQRESGNRQRSEESCTGIRYAGRIRERAAIRRKLYRNPVRRKDPEMGSDRKKVVPESGTQRECGNR